MLRQLLPTSFKNYIKLLKNKNKYRGRTILSHAISSNVKLGIPCSIHQNVVLENGVQIGNYSYVNNYTRIGKDVSIGNFCSISYNCQIGMSEHPTNFISTSPYTFGKENLFNEPISWEDFNKEVIIGNDVWIGSNAVVMQGVNIGDGAIVAAGAVVTKDVKAYSIVGGVPSKQIKMRFSEEKISYLQNIKWWGKSERELLQYKELFMARESWTDQIK